MTFTIKIEKYVFYTLIAGLILTILLNMNILPSELKFINLFLFIIIGLYYFPLLIYVKKYDNIRKEKKENILFILSNYILMLTCSFIAIIQIVQIEPIILFGNIVVIINGLAFIFFLLSGQTYKVLFVKHFTINSLLIFFQVMTF
jgi:hypothetical protein